MNIFAEIKALFTAKTFVETEIKGAKTMNGVTPGWKTTEFWVTMLGNLITAVGMLKSVIPANVGTIVLGVLNSVYTVVRGFVKTSATTPPTA